MRGLSVTIKYKGLKDRPVLITADGRYPPTTLPESRAPGLETPMGLFEASRDTGLKFQFKEEKQKQVLAEVYARIETLSDQIRYLDIPSGDLISRVKTAVSSQPEAVSASATVGAKAPGYHQAEVTWTAEPGQVLSKPFNPIEVVTGYAGEQSFTLVVDGEEHEISLEGGGRSETQEEFLGRLARTINLYDGRIEAEVEQSFQSAYLDSPNSNARDRVVRLSITAAGQGRGVDFHLKDSDGGSLISGYGLDAGSAPRSARLTLDGQRLDQDGNSFSLEQGAVTGEALSPTDGAARIKVSRGPEVIQEEMKAVLETYNGLMDYINQNGDLLRPGLKDRLVRPLEDRWQAVRDLGLAPKSSGKMEYSEKFERKLTDSFEQVRETLFGDHGWAQAMQTKMEQILDIDQGSFAWPLVERTALQARQQAWSLVNSIGFEIISRYV